MAAFTGTVKKLGLEGGLWALATDAGEMVELIDPPVELQQAGLRVRVQGNRDGADVTVGMIGEAIRVESFEVL